MFKTVLPCIHTEETAAAESIAAQYPEERIVRLATEKGSVGRKDVEALFGLSQSPAGRLLKKLTDGGRLVRYGGGKNARYYAV